MLGPMVLPGAATAPPPGGFRLPVLIAAVADLAAAETALAAGADLVEFVTAAGTGSSRTDALSRDDRRSRDEFLARHPDAVVRPGPAGQVTVTGGPLAGQTLSTLTLAQLAVHPADGHPPNGPPSPLALVAADLPATGPPPPAAPRPSLATPPAQNPPPFPQNPSASQVTPPLPETAHGPERGQGGPPTGPQKTPPLPQIPPGSQDLPPLPQIPSSLPVELPPLSPDLAAIVATAALASWLGAAAVRTRHVAQVRRALDQTAVIRGLRPPARTVRALA